MRGWTGRPGRGFAVAMLSAVVGLGGPAGCMTTSPPEDEEEPQVAVDQNDPDDHILAAGDPQVTVIEYLDLECPICGRFAREIFPTLREEYVDTGKVRWIVRHFPLTSRHPHAELAAQAAECAADQSVFWQYIDELFNNQAFLEQADLVDYAVALGLDGEALEACIVSGDKLERVDRDVTSGWEVDINGTPGFIIEDTVVVGILELDDFRMRLDQLLEDDAPALD